MENITVYPHDIVGVTIAEAAPRERQRHGFTALPAATGAGQTWRWRQNYFSQPETNGC